MVSRDSAAVARGVEDSWVEIDGPVHYVEFGGRGTPLVLVHGLGGSIENWLPSIPALAERGRVVALDLRGHGRTPMSEGQTSDVWSNQSLLDGFIEKVIGEPVVLVGNSMGGMISIIEAARRPERVSGLVLVDPSVPTPAGTEEDPVVSAIFATYAIEGAGEDFIRQGRATLGVEELTRRTLELCSADPARIDAEAVAAHVSLAQERDAMEWATDAFLQAARSLLDLKINRVGEYHGMIRSISCPTLMVQGSHDRLIPAACARAIADMRPDWAFELLEDTGHMPQLETPERFTDTVALWMQRTGLADPGVTR